ncbi:MAG: mandelate racemase/muconate lactonizing enzyme family protein, partial [Janthinobacterium lividum]
MTRRVTLRRVSLSYADGLVLHTASSGAVPALDELRLVVTQDGAVAALGATRLNIEYLSGIAAEVLCDLCVAAFEALDWSGPPAAWRLPPGLPAPARMLFEMAAADGAARAAGVPLSVWLGGSVTAAVSTNQTLFLSDDAMLLHRARAYAARGFHALKLRVGAGAVADDLRRIRLLRDALGDGLHLAADANGSWSEAEAPAILGSLAALGLDYVEQPIPAGDWAAIGRVSRDAALPVMLDESLSDAAAVDTLLRTRAAAMAHLKLAKLGGLDRLMAAGRRLREGGIPVMVGQMNEGAVSTLAAAHAAAALGVRHRELYGADGLRDDPVGVLRYADGCVHLPPGPGLGLDRHDSTG